METNLHLHSLTVGHAFRSLQALGIEPPILRLEHDHSITQSFTDSKMNWILFKGNL